MAKRFIDTDIWNKAWFRKLTPKMKACFFYLFTRCDHAGIFECDLELASFMIGQKVTEDEISKAFGDKVEVLSDDKWFIPDFIPFQYTKLNPNVKAHASVIKRLKQYSNSDLTVTKGLGKSLDTVLSTVLDTDIDTDKDKSKAKDKAKEKESYAPFVFLTTDEFSKLVEKFGNDKVVKSAIEILNNYKASNGKKYKSDYHALIGWVYDKIQKENPQPVLFENSGMGGANLHDS